MSLDVLANAATSVVALANHKLSSTVNIPNRPLNPFVNVVGAENFDVDFIAVK